VGGQRSAALGKGYQPLLPSGAEDRCPRHSRVAAATGPGAAALAADCRLARDLPAQRTLRGTPGAGPPGCTQRRQSGAKPSALLGADERSCPDHEFVQFSRAAGSWRTRAAPPPTAARSREPRRQPTSFARGLSPPILAPPACPQRRRAYPLAVAIGAANAAPGRRVDRAVVARCTARTGSTARAPPRVYDPVAPAPSLPSTYPR